MVFKYIGYFGVCQPDEQSTSFEFQIRPVLADRFKSMAVKEKIRKVLEAELTGKFYTDRLGEELTKKIASDVQKEVKKLNFKRYKLIVHVVFGEYRGAGVKVGARCLWDADTDNYASENFFNETIFCNVTVFGIYCY